MAVVFSILLWLVAVNINDPVERKIFRDVKVETTNTSVLTDENKLYQVLDDTDTVTVTVRASVLSWRILIPAIFRQPRISPNCLLPIRYPSDCP